jgi:cyclophilin family peptidyl-prolyl cis-trans isomerase
VLEALEDRCLLATASGVLGGTLFIDSNSNGRFDTGEFTLPGQAVTLTGTTTQGTPVRAVTTSDGSGAFTFQNVLPGTYQISSGFGAGPGIPGSGSSASNLSVAGGQTVSQNLAFTGLAPAFISLREFLSNSSPLAFLQTFAGTGPGQANFRPNNTPVVSKAIPDVAVGKNAADTQLNLGGFFSDPDFTDSLVRIDTTAGPINVELFDAKAPQTVANFLNYVQSGAYNNAIFHRLVKGFVLQGGGFTFNPTAHTLDPIAENPAILNEFGTSNTLGTLAMAKKGNDPNSATNQFFFNLADNSSNLDNQNGGFTVFGKLVSDADQAVVNALAATPTKQEPTPFDSIPLNNYNGNSFPTDTTDANYIKILDAVILKRDEFLTYSVVANDNPGLVTATTLAKDNPVLNLSFTHAQTGTAHVKVRATDRFGAFVDTTVTINVTNQAPTATVSLSPSNSISPQVTDTLTATATASDPNNDPVSLSYEWKVNGTTVKTTPNVFLTTDTLNLTGLVKPGDMVTVSVTPNDGTVNGTAATATATVASPTAGTVALSPTSPTPTTTLTATLTAANAATYTYVWKLNGTVVQTDPLTTTTDTLNLANLTNPAVKSGDVVSVEVTPSNGTFTGTMVNTQVTVV